MNPAFTVGAMPMCEVAANRYGANRSGSCFGPPYACRMRRSSVDGLPSEMASSAMTRSMPACSRARTDCWYNSGFVQSCPQSQSDRPHACGPNPREKKYPKCCSSAIA